MSIFDKLEKSNGGYIFLSHSHKDFPKVRQIRNTLEKRGFEPLCFYLKCLDDDSEIEDLIKREIDAREWFIFLNSENARQSKWVTLEREYVNRTDTKKIITVDLDDVAAVSQGIEKVVRNLRVFLSYSHKNESLVARIYRKLEEKDYLVFFDKLCAPTEYENMVAHAITEASQEGCVLALISAAYQKSPWAMRELLFALKQQGNVIPVILGDFEIDPSLQFHLDSVHCYHLSENPSDADIDELIENIGRSIIKK
jgi:hypothetical protein